MRVGGRPGSGGSSLRLGRRRRHRRARRAPNGPATPTDIQKFFMENSRLGIPVFFPRGMPPRTLCQRRHLLPRTHRACRYLQYRPRPGPLRHDCPGDAHSRWPPGPDPGCGCRPGNPGGDVSRRPTAKTRTWLPEWGSPPSRVFRATLPSKIKIRSLPASSTSWPTANPRVG